MFSPQNSPAEIYLASNNLHHPFCCFPFDLLRIQRTQKVIYQQVSHLRHLLQIIGGQGDQLFLTFNCVLLFSCFHANIQILVMFGDSFIFVKIYSQSHIINVSCRVIILDPTRLKIIFLCSFVISISLFSALTFKYAGQKNVLSCKKFLLKAIIVIFLSL